MVDNDSFTRQVAQSYRPASRAVYEAGDMDRGVHLALRQMQTELRSTGIPGLNEMIKIVQATRLPRSQARERQLMSQLESVARQSTNRSTQLVLESAKLLLYGPLAMITHNGRDPIICLVERSLINMIDSRVSPAGLVPALVHTGKVTFQEYHGRHQKFRACLEAAPGLRRLAEQLRVDPSGSRVTKQRRKAPKVELSTLVNMPLD